MLSTSQERDSADYVKCLLQNCDISITEAMEIPRPYAEPLFCPGNPVYFGITIDGWLNARLQYLQCVSNGDTAVFH